MPAGSGAAAGMAASTALFTDHYELTMLQGALHSGTADRRCVFEVFARDLPQGRRYGVVAGIDRFLDAVEWFRFDSETLEFLRRQRVVDERTREWLASFHFSGDVYGYAEGECYFPGSPILVVDGTFGEATLLETLALSILNHDCAIASAASRMATAAGDRPLIEMGTRRAHEEAAVAAARSAYVAGFSSTSNLRAGHRYGIPTAGTSAHSFTLLHDSERHAFRAQIEALGKETTLLVDTYDVAEAVHTGVELAGAELGAVRIDSGDLTQLAREVRCQLDDLGATGTRIVLTGDLDEHAIAALAVAPVSGYGVGTALVTGAGAPTASLVYKLVARAQSADPAAPLRPVAKRSVGKPGRGGRTWSARRRDERGVATAEVLAAAGARHGSHDRPLLRALVSRGEIVGRGGLAEARREHQRSLAELPPAALRLSRGEPAVPTVLENGHDEADGGGR